MEGWISLHRKILDWEWYSDTPTFRLFIHLLLKANHEDGRWQGQEIKRGQLITGRRALSKELKLGQQTIRTSLERLKSTNEITIKSTNKYSLVTIVNYEFYQGDGRKVTNKITSQVTNNQPTTNQQLTTNNNDNKDKNIYINLYKKYKQGIEKGNFRQWMKANHDLKEDPDYEKLTPEEQEKLYVIGG